MGKKNWIMIKRGLSQDPKHRERIGQAIWCFMHIIDRADWETGIVFDWKDKDEADDMGVNVRTLREWRRILDESGYITCKQEQYGQKIVIHNWTNPRNYSGDVLNPFSQGDKKTEPQDTPQGDTQGNRKDVTPTYSSGNHIPTKRGDLVDGIIELSKMPGVKKQIRLEGIQSRIAVAFNINCAWSRWERFIRFADKKEQELEQTLEVFADWLKRKPGFDITYWSPDKMQEIWPQAFDQSESEEYHPEYERFIPNDEGVQYAPPPKTRPRILRK